MSGMLGQLAIWFGQPMPRTGSPWESRLVLGFGLLIAIAGFFWIRRLIDPGPLARGESRWRYRDRRRLDRLPTWIASLRRPVPGFPWEERTARTGAWWAVRMEFAVAITLVLAVSVLLAMTGDRVMLSQTSDERLAAGFGLAGMLFGLWWMRRIHGAGLRNDSKTTWRYRDDV